MDICTLIYSNSITFLVDGPFTGETTQTSSNRTDDVIATGTATGGIYSAAGEKTNNCLEKEGLF